MGAGSKIKEILKDRGMTIKQLSEKFGVSINTLYSITKRDSKHIDESVLNRIAAALDIRPLYIMSFDGMGDEQLQGVSSEIDSVMAEVRDAIAKGEDPDGIDVDLENLSKKLKEYTDARDENDLQSNDARYHMLLRFYYSLSEEGQKVAVMRLKELSEHPKYKK